MMASNKYLDALILAVIEYDLGIVSTPPEFVDCNLSKILKRRYRKLWRTLYRSDIYNNSKEIIEKTWGNEKDQILYRKKQVYIYLKAKNP